MNWYLMALRKYASFEGRTQRAEYWFFTLFSFIITLVLIVIDITIGMFNISAGLSLSLVYIFLVLLPSVAALVRRLHDTNRSGWWFFLILIPIIGLVMLLMFLLQDSKEDNQYGLNPKKTTLLDSDAILEVEKLTFLRNKGILVD